MPEIKNGKPVTLEEFLMAYIADPVGLMAIISLVFAGTLLLLMSLIKLVKSMIAPMRSMGRMLKRIMPFTTVTLDVELKEPSQDE